jgi:hypothetical protein
MPKNAIEVRPGGIMRFSNKYLSCVAVENTHPTKSIYIRQYKRSIRVSDRIPAANARFAFRIESRRHTVSSVFDFLKRLFFPAFGPKPGKHMWKAIRMGGGGLISSPYEMFEWEALVWVSDVIKGEIAFVDREVGFIFYRPK